MSFVFNNLVMNKECKMSENKEDLEKKELTEEEKENIDNKEETAESDSEDFLNNEESEPDFEENEEERLQDENLKDKFDPSKYVPYDPSVKSRGKTSKVPFIVFGSIVVLGILLYIILGNINNNNRINDLAQEEALEETEQNTAPSTDLNDYKKKFWSGDTSITIGDAFSGYKTAGNVEYLLYEKDGRTVFQVKSELDVKQILDYSGPDVKIADDGDISEMAYMYFRKHQNEIKIYDNSYFYISKENPGNENLDLSKREIEIGNGNEVYKAEYSNSLSDIYNDTFNYGAMLKNMNNFYLKAVPKKTVDISVKFDTLEKADEELNKVYQNLTGALNDDQKAKLTVSQKAWLDYRDSEFKFLNSIFFIRDIPNSSEIADRFSKKYKVKIIENRIAELNSYKELVDKAGTVKQDEAEINKQKESLKERYATLLTHLNGDSLQLMKDSETKWSAFTDNDMVFIQSLSAVLPEGETPQFTKSFEPYSIRLKMLQIYDEILF
jgi:uncharacterized protein YecT (DUF1311 family)